MENVKLFQVKEVCRICNVTRKALLVYEEKGLLSPYYINPDTGYRYYNAENISKIMYIRKFQTFGFSLDDIDSYLHDTSRLSEVVDRLDQLKQEIEDTLSQLRERMMTEEYHHHDIFETTLPRCYYFAKKKETHTFLEALNYLREVHLEAIKTDRFDKMSKLSTAVLSYDGQYPDIFGTCEMLYCIPMLDGYDGPHARVEEETKAISILHRGSYPTLIESTKAILDYCKRKGLNPTGSLRFVWLEGPPIHGAAEEKYLTQIFIPIGG